jgi:hypothetical protein
MPTETSYSYTISTDFPGGEINSTKLTTDIENSIVTALERIDTDGDSVDIIFDDALSAGDKTTLDGDTSAPAGGLIAGNGTTLAQYKTIINAQVDAETERRISLGFEYPASSGNLFSMSTNAQINWLGLEAKASLLTYPYTIRTKDDLDSYDIVDETDAHDVVNAAFVFKETTLGQGRYVKTNVIAAADEAAADTTAASWLGGGPP